MSSYNSGPISQLQPGTAVLGTDVYPATDTTDLTQSPSGTTKKYTISQLLGYVENTIVSNDIQTAKYATTANLDAVYVNGVQGSDDGIGATLTNNGAFAALSVDGFAVSVGDRILVAYQSSALQNGVYTVTNVGSGSTNWVLTRATDFDGSSLGEIRQGDFIGVLFGSINALSWWFMTSETPLVVGTDAIVFVKQSNVVAEPWVNQASASVTMAVNTGYTTSAGATTVTYTLPVTAAQGSYVKITGNDVGAYVIAQGDGQQIKFGTSSTTLGVTGSVSAEDQYCNIVLRCIVANTIWTVESFVGGFTIL